jgi:hypothetical protein
VRLATPLASIVVAACAMTGSVALGASPGPAASPLDHDRATSVTVIVPGVLTADVLFEPVRVDLDLPAVADQPVRSRPVSLAVTNRTAEPITLGGMRYLRMVVAGEGRCVVIAGREVTLDHRNGLLVVGQPAEPDAVDVAPGERRIVQFHLWSVEPEWCTEPSSSASWRFGVWHRTGPDAPPTGSADAVVVVPLAIVGR